MRVYHVAAKPGYTPACQRATCSDTVEPNTPPLIEFRKVCTRARKRKRAQREHAGKRLLLCAQTTRWHQQTPPSQHTSFFVINNILPGRHGNADCVRLPRRQAHTERQRPDPCTAASSLELCRHFTRVDVRSVPLPVAEPCVREAPRILLLSKRQRFFQPTD